MSINVKKASGAAVQVHFIVRPYAYAEGQRCYPKPVPPKVWIKPKKNIKLRAAWSA